MRGVPVEGDQIPQIKEMITTQTNYVNHPYDKFKVINMNMTYNKSVIMLDPERKFVY